MEPEVGHGTRSGRVRVGYVNRAIGKKKCRRPLRIERRKCRRLMRIKRSLLPEVSMALQELFVTCRDVFKGPGTVPLPLDVHKLCRILDNMKAEDVGLSQDLQFINPTPRVAHTTIYKCNKFSMCIFFIPAKGVIPLHNHPGMTVFSKLLLGKMHIKSYDLVDPDHPPAIPISPNSQLRLAKLKADSVFTAPCDTSVLYPTTGGNIHAFTAITPCAVLDVLGPPYSVEDGRDCSYYKDHPYSSFSNGDGETRRVKGEGGDERYGWLEEIEMPENSQMYGIEYLGPQVMDTTCTTC